MNVVRDVLTNTLLLALEEWGMMLVEPAETSRELFEGVDDLCMGGMQFRGVMNGTITVLCGRTLMENLCRNVMGSDPEEEVSEEECRDALCELTNILSGNFLTEAYGDDTVFDLVYPAVAEVTQQKLDEFFSNRLVQCFEADGEYIAVSLGGPVEID